jgi:hypothetical protein
VDGKPPRTIPKKFTTVFVKKQEPHDISCTRVGDKAGFITESTR